MYNIEEKEAVLQNYKKEIKRLSLSYLILARELIKIAPEYAITVLGLTKQDITWLKNVNVDYLEKIASANVLVFKSKLNEDIIKKINKLNNKKLVQHIQLNLLDSKFT